LEALKAWKALDWEVRKSERVRWARTVETSLEERIVIVEGEGEGGGGGAEDGATSSAFSFFLSSFAGITGRVGGGVGAPEGGVMVVELTFSHSGSDSIVELIVVGGFLRPPPFSFDKASSPDRGQFPFSRRVDSSFLPSFSPFFNLVCREINDMSI